MPRTPEADDLREALLDELRTQGVAVEKLSEMADKEDHAALRQLFWELGASGREVYFVPGVGLINIHVSTDRPAWWNVMKSVKASFECWTKLVGQTCLFVFLSPRQDGLLTGYVAKNFTSEPFVALPMEQQSKFMVKPDKHLNPLRRLATAKRIAESIIGSK